MTINYFARSFALVLPLSVDLSFGFAVLEAPLPVVFKKFAMLNRGLVVVTGPTGSGKSTTLAAIVDYCNRNRKDHIITLEDPIEFVHESKNCLVNHREVGVHTKSFSSGLRGALREDPDVILVGEMRDLETIELAITAAAKMQAAVEARGGSDLLVFARTSAASLGRVDEAIERFRAFEATGVDALFLPGVRNASELEAISGAIRLPLVAGGVADAVARPDVLARLGVRLYSTGHQPFSVAVNVDAEVLDLDAIAARKVGAVNLGQIQSVGLATKSPDKRRIGLARGRGSAGALHPVNFERIAREWERYSRSASEHVRARKGKRDGRLRQC